MHTTPQSTTHTPRARQEPHPRPSLALLGLALALLTAAAQAQHDCTPYAPSTAGDVIDATWAQAFERDTYTFTVPDDPGGGYVVAFAETTAPSEPHMRIIPPSGLGVVTQTAPTDPTSLSPQLLEVAFEVAAGTTFTVELFEDAVSSPSAFPVPYRWGWTFVSRVDCYEANDGIPNQWPAPTVGSKTVPFDQELEAFSLAGHLDFTIGGEHTYDWYDFTLDAPADIWLGTTAVPTNQVLRVRLFGANGLAIADSVPEVGQPTLLGPVSLGPGTYYFHVLPEVRGGREAVLSEGESLPDHFDTPYRFIVSTRALCIPSATRACLQDGRFSVDIDWQDFTGGAGPGRVVPGGTDDSALFSFFDPDNWEMLVKVLDGCAVNGSFWVFAAATTDVAYTLTVTDTATGSVRQYTNALGNAADATTDTTAFACGGSPLRTGGPQRLTGRGRNATVDAFAQASPRFRSTASRSEQGKACSDNTTLCFDQERFAVEVEWRDFAGNRGSGRVAPLKSEDSGIFWFFDADNWEMLVKVLDGCAVNDRFWVFSAATTDVEYTLRVTDQQTGAMSTYFNPRGVAAPAITDTQAFATCP